MSAAAPSTRTLLAGAEAAGLRLDRYLCASFPDRSRSELQRLIDGGAVEVAGRAARAALRLRGGERIVVRFLPPAPLELRPEAIPLRLIYEDPRLAVVDKPAGMVVHPGAGRREGTLVHALLHRYGALSAGDPARPGIVHRLDKDTSGLLVVALDSRAHRHLVEQFQQRRVEKLYWGLALGELMRAGRIELPLGRDRRDRTRISPRSVKLRAAVTLYRPLRRWPGLTLLELRLLTGRTHQIRVHLQQLGHPLAGDPIYGRSRARLTPIQELASSGGLLLHSARLGLRHPEGPWLELSAPLPPAFAAVLAMLSCGDGKDAAVPVASKTDHAQGGPAAGDSAVRVAHHDRQL